MTKRKQFWIIFSGVSVLLVVLIWGGFVAVYNRLQLVDLGLSSPNFPYNRYSQEELEKLYPENIGEGVLTVRTPEQTHRMFVDNLKAEDFDGAVECCFLKRDWENMKTALESIKTDNELDGMIKDLDVELVPNSVLETKAGYDYYSSDDRGGYMEFVKDKNGVWLIESL